MQLSRTMRPSRTALRLKRGRRPSLAVGPGVVVASLALLLGLGGLGCAQRTIIGSAIDGPDVKPGRATVRGVAQLLDAKKSLITCAGRRVLLVPRTPETTAWVSKLESATASSWSPTDAFTKPFQPLFRGEPEIVQSAGRFTLGYGAGRFEFTNVAAGEYYVVFRLDEDLATTAEVAVRSDREVVPSVVARSRAGKPKSQEGFPPILREWSGNPRDWPPPGVAPNAAKDTDRPRTNVAPRNAAGKSVP